MVIETDMEILLSSGFGFIIIYDFVYKFTDDTESVVILITELLMMML